MSGDIQDIYDSNPSITIPINALIYLGLSPYNTTDDSAIIWQDLKAQLNSLYVNKPSSVPVADNAIVRFDSTSGLSIKNSGSTLDDNNLLTTVTLNVSNTGVTTGGIKFSGANFVSNYGTNNLFVGASSGNLTLTTGSAQRLVGIGASALSAVTTASSVTAVGYQAGHGITTAINCAIFGSNAGKLLTTVGGHAIFGNGAAANAVTSSTLTLFGNNAGSNYTGSESYNIILGPNTGVLGESNTIRIGDGANYSSCYIDGIAGVSISSSKKVAMIDSGTNQLGSISILTSDVGGTGNGFTKFSGATSSEKTYTLPDASDSVACLGQANTFTKAQRGAFFTLTDASTIAIDASLSNNFNVTLGGNRTLGVPTNLIAGQSGVISVRQDITGSRTLAYSWSYMFPFGSAPILSIGALSFDQLNYVVNSYSTSTVTITIAAPGVVTWTSHGLVSGQRIQLTTTGALPTGLTGSTTYWVTVVDANSFKLSSSFANAQAATFITTSGSQSGVHTATNASITISINNGLA